MIKPTSEHWVHVEESARRVRVTFGGETIADSRHVMLLREAKCLPVYYFPPEDVRLDVIQPAQQKSLCPYKGEASYWTLRAGAKVAENAAWSYPDPAADCSAIKGYLAFEWNEMDHWYEEEEEIFVHPRDPYKRVDVLKSSRHVRVLVGEKTVAESRQPRLLFETNHPVRYYISPEDIRMELLVPSATSSRCPYKGIASYWSVRLGDQLYKDQAWSYLEPISECPKIKGLIAFFQERSATIYVDGERIPAPKTRWAEIAE